MLASCLHSLQPQCPVEALRERQNASLSFWGWLTHTVLHQLWRVIAVIAGRCSTSAPAPCETSCAQTTRSSWSPALHSLVSKLRPYHAHLFFCLAGTYKGRHPSLWICSQSTRYASWQSAAGSLSCRSPTTGTSLQAHTCCPLGPCARAARTSGRPSSPRGVGDADPKKETPPRRGGKRATQDSVMTATPPTCWSALTFSASDPLASSAAPSANRAGRHRHFRNRHPRRDLVDGVRCHACCTLRTRRYAITDSLT
jgi:hypothetical protein